MKQKIYLFLLLIIIFLSFNAQIEAATINVCPDTTGNCQYVGTKGIQEAIEKAADGDTISIKSGNYPSSSPIVIDKNYKYENCLLNTRGKKLTLSGEGNVVIDNQNGEPMTTGICVMGGEVNINSISVKQTLRFALYIQNAKAIVTNMKTIDIDNTSVVIRQSRVMIFNSLFTGGGIDVAGDSYARIENNTTYGGAISFNLCNNDQTTADVSNNIMARASITAACPQGAANIKLKNNIVYKGSTTGDMACVGPGADEGSCAAGELCTDVRYEWPGFVGADENGTICVWGEGWIQGDFNTRTDSLATKAGVGLSAGTCVSGNSASCKNYIAANPLPEIQTQNIQNTTTNTNQQTQTQIQERVDSGTITACPNGPSQICLQQAIDSSKNGNTIIIKSGTYSGSDNYPLSPDNTTTTCFINLGEKSLVLKGENGTVLFGEGHDKPDVYAKRNGICGRNSDVVIDSIRVKEFQGGGLNFANSRLVLKNSIIEGNDSGGTHFNNVSLLAVNNYFVANIGIQPAGTAAIKAYNNTFYESKAINTACNINVPPIDFINNIVVDPELTIGAGWIYGDCPDTASQFKTKNIKYNLIWKNNHPCYENHEYCDDFTGKVNADPQFVEPVIDQRGMAAWANFNFNPGSPAVGAGDPGIPGGKDLGISGGPCTNGASNTCGQFIQNNLPALPETVIPGLQQPGAQLPNPQGRVVFEDNVLPQFMPIINMIKIPFSDLFRDNNLIIASSFNSTSSNGWITKTTTPQTTTPAIAPATIIGKEFRNEAALQMIGFVNGDNIIAAVGAQKKQFVQNHRYRVSFKYTATSEFQIASGSDINDIFVTVPLNQGVSQFATTTFVSTKKGGCTAGNNCWLTFIVNNNTVNISDLKVEDLSEPVPQKKDEFFMNLFLYVFFSVVFIMFYHMALSIQNFNIFLMIAYFVIGGVVGLWFKSWEMGMAISMALTLIFI